jgi:tetratricopeptide (TPR) repeat protein
MSIIHKALKKAEEAKTGKPEIEKTQIYSTKEKKIWIVIILGLVLGIAAFMIVSSWQKSKPDIKSKAANLNKQTLQTVQKEPVPAPAEKIPAQPSQPEEKLDSAKLADEAVKQIKEKKYIEAEKTLKKALALKNNDPSLHNNLGLALRHQGRYKEAAASYEKAITLNPDYVEAMNNLAVTYEKLGDRVKAKNFYKKTLLIKPAYAEAHLNYALFLETEEKNSEAESHYHTFLNLSSDETLKQKVRVRLKLLKK